MRQVWPAVEGARIMQRTVTIFVCDRDGTTTEVPADTRAAEQPAPKGWKRVIVEPLNAEEAEKAEPEVHQLCPSCYREQLRRVLAPVATVADLQALPAAEASDRLRPAEDVPAKVAQA